MKKIFETIKKDRAFMNMISGAGGGLTAWILSSFFERLFGLSVNYQYISQFITGGIVIGGIIGMISQEFRWHKKIQESQPPTIKHIKSKK